jgi:hypothetical protein
MFMKRLPLSFNILGLLAGCLMIAAMLFPWWSFQIEFSDRTDLFPYLISGPGSELVGYKRSPMMTLLTGVLIAAILLCLVGSVLKSKRSKVLIGASGILVLLAVWRLLVRIARVADRFDLSLQGHGRGSMGGFAKVEVSTWLRPGLYLIIIAGVLALLASVYYTRVTTSFDHETGKD